ncbi:MAG: 50S ribosomal protein L23 [Candidatus Roizmanbacteria bacterium GW2011_GWA2_34_18]|uniref:Large ribosomal subunit protein uL23 n=1 Tax=Candidatus Roizmanbacteria bacterium GW2011_GWA2_34_18 TaxID=1618477 RepID=A0A0G0AUM8_9BACT|nr:MAG: 50S ribosomal protein L23 [Candidatus Roizmanbacteria bacterium GW2011_GWA2_34_18]
MLINKVLIKPILTEKATNLVQSNVYMFEVDKRANKFQIKQALEKLYKVKTGAVKIMIRKGKERKTGKKMRIKKMADRKIAFIRLIEGKIDLFPQK